MRSGPAKGGQGVSGFPNRLHPDESGSNRVSDEAICCNDSCKCRACILLNTRTNLAGIDARRRRGVQGQGA